MEDFENEGTGAEYDHAEESLEVEQEHGQESEEESHDEGQETENQESKQVDDRPWPKKAARALQRQKREAARLRAEINELRQMVHQRNVEPKQDVEPDQDSFETYSEYLKAHAAYTAKQAYREEQKAYQEQQNQTLQEQEMQFSVMQRAQAAQKMTAELAKTVPDIYDVLADNDELDALPAQYQQMILSTKNPSLTAYNLAKSNNLSEMAYAHPQMAAQMIFSAANKGVKPPVNQGKKPTPMRGLGGNSGGSGGVDPNESYESLKKRMGW